MSHPRHQGAFSLVELLAAVTVSAAVVGMAIGLMVALLQCDRAVRRQTQWISSAGRLAEQFRRDVRQAIESPKKDGPSENVVLRPPTGPAIVYRIEPGRIVRRAENPGEAAEQWFNLPQDWTAGFEVRTLGSKGIVTLYVESPGVAGPALRIEALVAGDHRPTLSPKERP